MEHSALGEKAPEECLHQHGGPAALSHASGEVPTAGGALDRGGGSAAAIGGPTAEEPSASTFEDQGGDRPAALGPSPQGMAREEPPRVVLEGDGGRLFAQVLLLEEAEEPCFGKDPAAEALKDQGGVFSEFKALEEPLHGFLLGHAAAEEALDDDGRLLEFVNEEIEGSSLGELAPDEALDDRRCCLRDLELHHDQVQGVLLGEDTAEEALEDNSGCGLLQLFDLHPGNDAVHGVVVLGLERHRLARRGLHCRRCLVVAVLEVLVLVEEDYGLFVRVRVLVLEGFERLFVQDVRCAGLSRPLLRLDEEPEEEPHRGSAPSLVQPFNGVSGLVR
mmetsp:Transcript_10298/g.29409  ORF Transcript_10298/g.29409 Transcript_10298/m.29409 type:complete len:333 (-) Transcript_10298:93-1091(-)